MFGREKYYTQKELDDILAKEKKECERIISSLRTQNAELRQMHEREKEKTGELSANEDKIKEALVHAIEKAKSIEQEGKKFYEAQLMRVKMLYAKWVNIIEEVSKKYNIKNAEELNAQKFANEIEEFLTKTVSEEIKHETPQLDSIKIVGADEKYYHKQLLTRMSGLMSSVSARLKEEEQPKKPEIIVPLPRVLIERRGDLQQNSKPYAERNQSGAEEAKAQFESETNRLASVRATQNNQAVSEMQKNNAYAGMLAEQKAETNFSTKPTEQKSSVYASIIDKIIQEQDNEDVLSSTYAKRIVKETTASAKTNTLTGADKKESNLSDTKSENGFDLREALNPRESLEDILKEFNF